MLFNNLNPFVSKGTKNKSKEDYYSVYYYNYLWNIAMTLFEWKGKEFEGSNATLNRDYLEFVLLSEGQATFIKDKDNLLRGLKATRIGLDCYNFPTNILSANPILGDLEGKVNKDCVYIRNNKFATSAISIISHYAYQLAKLLTSLDISLQNNRMTKIFMAETQEQAELIKRLTVDVASGEEATIIKTGILENILGDGVNKHIPVYGTPSEYLAASFIQDMRSTLNNFLTAFGVDCNGANVVKKAQNVSDEVQSNNQEIAINRDFWLSTRKEACNICNEIFGTNLSVNIKKVNADEYINDIVTNKVIEEDN